eukprot:XP_011662388.1 PREDICTED: low-density lipoprotein receptor-related protein 4 [Strongylocentrotus purpuratus]
MSMKFFFERIALDANWTLGKIRYFIFWSASGKADKLERISTNGKHTKRVSKNDLKVIRNLAVDVIDKRVFWLDIGKRRIESVNYLGKKRNTIMEKISGAGDLGGCGDNEMMVPPPVKSNTHGVLVAGVLGITASIYILISLFNSKGRDPTQKSIRTSLALGDLGVIPKCGQALCQYLGRSLPTAHVCRGTMPIGADDWSVLRGGQEPKILYSHRDTISEADIQNALPGQQIATNLDTVLSLDIHHRERMMFWIDRSTNRIERMPLDGGEIQHIVSRHMHTPESLAVDWVHNKIYWTDYRLKQIERCDLNGSNREVVFSTGKRRPRAIALDPFEGFIFWSASGKADKLERISTNGKHTKRVSKNDLKVIRNLAVDVIDKRVFWLDIGKRRIESVNYLGKKRNTIMEKISPNAFGLAIFEQKVYWADSVESSIHSIVKYGDKESRVDWSIFIESSPKAVCINHPSTQPSYDVAGSFNCSTHSDCQIDLPDLTSDPSRSYLIYANTTSIHRIYADGSGHMTIAKAGLNNISTIEFDPLEKMVYFADHGRGVIERVRTDGRGLEVVSTRGVDSVEGLAIDWMHRRLYWVDSVGSYIATQSLYPGSRHTVLMSELDEPHGIAVHPALNIIYWSSWGESPKIEAARHDGSNRVTVAASPVRPTKLAIDYTHNKVLWIDAGLNTINEADLDGTNHRVINRGELQHPFGLALYGGLMWSTDSEQREVLALDRNNGEKRVAFSGDWIIPVDVHLIHSGRRVIGDIDPCQVFNGGCEQICIYAHTNQAICNCETGYHLRRDRISCEPDECHLGLHNCNPNALCTNTPDGYQCTCKEGFLGDGFSCIGSTTPPQRLIAPPEVIIIRPQPPSSSSSPSPTVTNKDEVTVEITNLATITAITTSIFTTSPSSSDTPRSNPSSPTTPTPTELPSTDTITTETANDSSRAMTFLLYPIRSTLTPPTVKQESTFTPTKNPRSKGGHLGGGGGEAGVTPKRPSGHFAVCPLTHKYYCLNGGKCTFLKAVETPSCECQTGFAGQRCEFAEKHITKGVNMQKVTAVSAGVLAPLFLVLVISTLLCYWKRARSKARSQAYNIDFVMSAPPPRGNGSLPKKTNMNATLERLDKNHGPLIPTMSQGSTQSEPPTRSPPKPPTSPLQNCYSDPSNLILPGATLQAIPNTHHYYKVPRSGAPAPKPKPSLKPNNLQLSVENALQAQTKSTVGRNKFQSLETNKSKTLDTAYLTPKEIMSEEPETQRVSAYIDVNDSRSFLPAKTFLSIKNKLSRRIENVYVNMPKTSTGNNVK